jgi:hypothetical protein
MYRFCTILFVIASVQLALAQADDQQEVKKVIQTMFTGIYEGDSSKVRSVFAKNISMATVLRDKNGAPMLRQEASLNGFLKAIGTPHPEKWTEEIWDVQVKIDGDFAQAWCEYAFYVDHTFSHCGVDAFHLHKTVNGWKIFHLADTRRKDTCNIPKAIQDKHTL